MNNCKKRKSNLKKMNLGNILEAMFVLIVMSSIVDGKELLRKVIANNFIEKIPPKIKYLMSIE